MKKNATETNRVVWLKLTKSPTGLYKGDIRVVDQERDGPSEEIGFGSEIGVEDDNVVAFLDVVVFKAFFKRSSFITSSRLSNLVPNINAFACPPQTFSLNHILQNNPLIN